MRHKDEVVITVFLADDHTIVRDGLRAFLNVQPNIQVVGEAGNGGDALRRIQELEPDVAVLDIAMPELNGIDVTRRIRQISPMTRIVILSMHATENLILEALQAGADAYLLKESAGKELVKAVHAVHAGHRYLSQKVSDKVIDSYVLQQGAAEASHPLAHLSHREREVLRLAVEGKSNVEIADIFSLAPKTVATYRSRMMQKLGISDLPTLVKFAIRHGLTSLE
jgi:DNA-binding NarL/FixJ family response regulator